MPATDALDAEFETFLAEVDQLSIGHDDAADETDDNGETEEAAAHAVGVHGDRSTAASTGFHSKAKSRKEKLGVIANAGSGRRAWSEFQKLDLSSTSGGGSSGSTAEGASSKVSFAIKGAKGKKTKPPERENDGGVGSKAQSQGAARGKTPPLVAEAYADIDGGCPRWTLVIDTCSLIEDNGRNVRRLIDLAHRSLSARAMSQTHGRSGTSVAAAVDEPIDIVIPSKVWSELDFQSKSDDDDDKAYAARAAVRMLRDELEAGGVQTKGGEICHVLRSQSLAGEREVSERYLLNEGATTNDDHILACALMEQEAFGAKSRSLTTTAGGTVLVTLDNNLACKAYGNGVKVYSPVEFGEYYERRMASLRQRASGNAADFGSTRQR